MRMILKEPLVHFLLLGVGLFVLFGFLGDDEQQPVSDRTIVVSAARVEQLGALFAKTWQRPPTGRELKGLVDDFVLEEIYYREAVAMGIDQNDTIIRRRLRQKMEFLTEDIAAQASATDEQLKAYLEENPSAFETDPAWSFRQVYFNPEKHGDDPIGFAKARVDELRAGIEVDGDGTLLPGAFENATARRIDATFGAGFAARLDDLETGRWSDPIRSGLGIHLVRIESRRPGAVPDFRTIRPQLEREWSHRNRLKMRDEFNRQLLEGYEVVIEAPEIGREPASEAAE